MQRGGGLNDDDVEGSENAFDESESKEITGTLSSAALSSSSTALIASASEKGCIKTPNGIPQSLASFDEEGKDHVVGRMKDGEELPGEKRFRLINAQTSTTNLDRRKPRLH